MSVVWFVICVAVIVAATIAYYDWHFSEPQRRKRAVKALVRGRR